MPKGKPTRYYSEDDQDGITRSKLKRLGKAKQKEYIKYWFGNMFEDPANETPYSSEEGGYQFIWGGPYDAADEINNEFMDIASEKAIEEAVEELQEEGTYEWAPGSAHPDHKAARDESDYLDLDLEDELPDFAALAARLQELGRIQVDSPEERQRRQALLDGVRGVLASIPDPQHGGIGHNNPPTDDEDAEIGKAELKEALQTIEDEASSAEPDAAKIATLSERIKNGLYGVPGKIGTLIGESAKGGAKKTGELMAAYLAGHIDLSAKLHQLLQMASEWLQFLVQLLS